MTVGTVVKGGHATMQRFSAKLRLRNQITLASELVKKLNLDAGDEIEFTVENGKLIGTPKLSIDKSQAWYFTPEWQYGEREAEEHLAQIVKTGFQSLKQYDSVADALTELDK